MILNWINLHTDDDHSSSSPYHSYLKDGLTFVDQNTQDNEIQFWSSNSLQPNCCYGWIDKFEFVSISLIFNIQGQFQLCNI